MRAVVAARKASTFIHSIRRPLRVTEVWSHDANVTLTMRVARRAPRIAIQLERSAKRS